MHREDKTIKYQLIQLIKQIQSHARSTISVHQDKSNATCVQIIWLWLIFYWYNLGLRIVIGFFSDCFLFSYPATVGNTTGILA